MTCGQKAKRHCQHPTQNAEPFAKIAIFLKYPAHFCMLRPCPYPCRADPRLRADEKLYQDQHQRLDRIYLLGIQQIAQRAAGHPPKDPDTTAFIARTVSKKHLRILRKSDIWIEAGSHYRSLARYHGYKGEIFQENLNPAKFRDVEIFGKFARTRHPSLILHELAHVHHDRKLNLVQRANLAPL